MLERVIHLPRPVNLLATVAGVRRGDHDPTFGVEGPNLWRASRSPAGASTLRFVPDGDRVLATGWGPGAEAALEVAPSLIGVHDDDGGWDPDHPTVSQLWDRHHAVRIPRSGAVTESLIACVLEQNVTIFEARRAQTQIVHRFSEPAPGPGALWLPPDPEVLASTPHYDLHLVGVEQSQADTVRRIAANARRLDALALLPAATAFERILDVAGVGPWSAAESATVAVGHADAVPLGDPRLPADVTFALTGTATDDDDAMLEVLEPFAGQRGRVIRLIRAAGLEAPQRSHRYAPPS